MEIPTKINNIIQRILESEDEWKALYMASWGCANFYLKPTFENTELWDKEVPFGLPASKKGWQKYTPAKLYAILTSKDMEFTLGHLQKLFSLFEELVVELCPFVCDGQEIKADKFENLKKFLLGKESYEKFKTDITEDELKELRLAKETRNCFIHDNSKVDKRWLEAYKEARGENLTVKTGDELPVYVSQIEDWHGLVVKIISKIKEAVIRL